MAEHAQIDIRKGPKVVRIHSGWGTPHNVLPALRRTAASGRKTPQAIAREFLRQLEDSSFGLNIITEDFQPDALSFHYTVDVSSLPWRVLQEKCASHKWTVRDGVGCASPDITPARKRTVLIRAA